MSEIEELSSTFELESIAQAELKRRAREKAARAAMAAVQSPQAVSQTARQEEPAVEQETPEPKPVQAKPKKAKKQAERQAPSGKQDRVLARKHESERKMLQKSIDEMAKKRDRDIRELMQQALKEQYAHLDKERSDYLAVISELKASLESQSRDIITGSQQSAAGAAQEEVERMINWFHEEFMSELDKKSQQYEELKASSEKQVNKMSAESDSKSQKIMMLDEKIKQLALRLPKDVRKELADELGLDYLKEPEPAQKAEKKAKEGIFTKFAQMFKRSPKSAQKPAQPKPRQAKPAQKRPGAQNVIAQ